MKIGSLVRLTRPWEGNLPYKNWVGIVVGIHMNHDGEFLYDIRVDHHLYPMLHNILTAYPHRLDVLEE